MEAYISLINHLLRNSNKIARFSNSKFIFSTIFTDERDVFKGPLQLQILWNTSLPQVIAFCSGPKSQVVEAIKKYLLEQDIADNQTGCGDRSRRAIDSFTKSVHGWKVDNMSLQCQGQWQLQQDQIRDEQEWLRTVFIEFAFLGKL